MKQLFFSLFVAITLNPVLANESNNGGHGGGHGDHGPGGGASEHFTKHCAQCHGENGISKLPTAPNLAGQKELYVMAQLKDFRDGKRTGSFMPAIVRGMTDAEIAEMADFLATLTTCNHLEE